MTRDGVVDHILDHLAEPALRAVCSARTPSEATEVHDHGHARQSADLDNGYDICLQTADGGQDGTALFSHAGLPRDVYAAPCALIEPSLALVAEDAAGVGGYIVAALDGRDFR